MTKNSCVVRPVEAQDYAEWLPLCRAYQDFYEVRFEDGVTEAAWARFQAADEPMEAAVAEVDGVIQGYVTIVFHRTTWSVHDVCYLEDLYVSPGARSAGLGEALIDWAKTRAQLRTCASLYWHTQHFNERARRLYDRVAVLAPSRVYRKAL